MSTIDEFMGGFEKEQETERKFDFDADDASEIHSLARQLIIEKLPDEPVPVQYAVVDFLNSNKALRRSEAYNISNLTELFDIYFSSNLSYRELAERSHFNRLDAVYRILSRHDLRSKNWTRDSESKQLYAAVFFKTPLTVGELAKLTDWSADVSSLDRTLAILGERPWASKHSKDNERTVSNYVVAADFLAALRLFKEEETEPSQKQLADLTGYARTTVSRYIEDMPRALPQLWKVEQLRKLANHETQSQSKASAGDLAVYGVVVSHLVDLISEGLAGGVSKEELRTQVALNVSSVANVISEYQKLENTIET